MKYKVGQFVEVISNESCHEFPIGSVVKITEVSGYDYTCESDKAYWFLGESEIKPTDKTDFFTPEN